MYGDSKIVSHYRIIVVIFLCAILVIAPSTNSFGERLLEQYGKKVTVSAEMTKIKINYKGGFADFNDPGGFMTGEVAVLSSYNEPGHKTILETELHLSDWDLQMHDSVPHNAATPGKNKINKAFADQTKYTHVQCHPLGTLKTVFVVYNVNGNWPNWSNLLGDVLASAGVTTIKELAVQVGYIGAETITTGGLVAAIAVSVALKQLLYHIRGNESLGTGTQEIDLQSELGDNGEQTYTVPTAETQYGNAEVTFVVRTHTDENVDCSEVSSTAAMLHSGEQYALLDDSLSTPDEMLIANAIQTSSISIKNDGNEHVSSIYLHFDDGSIRWVGAEGWNRFRINDNTILLTSDTALKANESVNVLFKLDDTNENIADPVILLGSQDLGVSDFPDQLISTSPGMLSTTASVIETKSQVPLSDDALTHGAKILLAHQTSMAWLLEIQNYNIKLYNDLAAKAWNTYDKTKDSNVMQEAIDFEQKSRQASIDAKTTVHLLNSARSQAELFYDLALQNGLDPSNLKTEAAEKLTDIVDVTRINNLTDLANAAQHAKYALSVMYGQYQDLVFGIDTAYANTILTKPMQEFWQSACNDPSQIASLPHANFIGSDTDNFEDRCIAYNAVFAGLDKIPGSNYVPKAEHVNSGLIISATPQSVTGTHKIGVTPTGSPCPTPLGTVVLNSNQQGTWSLQSKPSWIDVILEGDYATIAFNCDIEPVPQTLSGNIVYSFSDSLEPVTIDVPVTVQVT